MKLGISYILTFSLYFQISCTHTKEIVLGIFIQYCFLIGNYVILDKRLFFFCGLSLALFGISIFSLYYCSDEVNKPAFHPSQLPRG